MEEDKIFELFDKYQDQWNEWDGSSIGYTNFEKAINEALRLHIVSQQRELLKAFYAYVDDKWALGTLTDKVDEVIEGFEKSL